MPKLDHKRTEESLLETLVGLLKTERLYEVQVRELCARAHVSRTTFYKHYEGMPSFVEEVEASFLAKMNDAFYFGNVFVHVLDIDAYQTFLRCAEFMAENGELVRALLGPNGSSSLKGKISAMWTQQAEEALLIRWPRIQERVNIEIVSTCLVSSMLGLLELAVFNPNKYTSEYLARQMTAVLYDRMLADMSE